MEEKQNRQTKLMYAMEVFGDIFGLNVMFIAFSLPIITIGASLTALFSVNLKLVRKEESSIGKSFVEAFKKNFKVATKIWLIVLGALVVIGAEVYMVLRAEGFLRNFYIVVVVIELLIFALTIAYLFPLVARYENTIKNTFKNAFLLGISNLWSTVKIVLIWFAPPYFTLYYSEIFWNLWYLWFIIMFGLMGYCSSITLRKVFDKIDKAQNPEESTAEETEDIVNTAESKSYINREGYNTKGSIVYKDSNNEKVLADSTTSNDEEKSNTEQGNDEKRNNKNTDNEEDNAKPARKNFHHYVNKPDDEE